LRLCLSVKQTILDNINNIEHYRIYSYDAIENATGLVVNINGWSKWFSNLTRPRGKITAEEYWETNKDESFPLIGIDIINLGSIGLHQSGLCTMDAIDLLNYYTERHVVYYDKAQPLTDAQKKQARDNIGAISVKNDSTLKEGEILVYDTAEHKLVSSGYTFESLKEWI
jgi:hypothetical protein